MGIKDWFSSGQLKNPPSDAPASTEAPEQPSVFETFQQADAEWKATIKDLVDTRPEQGPPQVSREVADRFRKFAALRFAIALAEQDGRDASTFTAADIQEGDIRCEERVAIARKLKPLLSDANGLWHEEQERTGNLITHTMDLFHDLCQQVEDLAETGGDLNLYLFAHSWRTLLPHLVGDIPVTVSHLLQGEPK